MIRPLTEHERKVDEELDEATRLPWPILIGVAVVGLLMAFVVWAAGN